MLVKSLRCWVKIRAGEVFKRVVITTNTTKILHVCSTDFWNCTTKNQRTLGFIEKFEICWGYVWFEEQVQICHQ